MKTIKLFKDDFVEIGRNSVYNDELKYAYISEVTDQDGKPVKFEFWISRGMLTVFTTDFEVLEVTYGEED